MKGNTTTNHIIPSSLNCKSKSNKITNTIRNGNDQHIIPLQYLIYSYNGYLLQKSSYDIAAYVCLFEG